jgi:hypothetical protein
MRITQLFPHLKSLRIEQITIGPQGVTRCLTASTRRSNQFVRHLTDDGWLLPERRAVIACGMAVPFRT